MPLLSVTNLTTAFATSRGEITAIEDVTFSLDEGEILGIVGESGSGKSVTALTIMGLLPQPPARVAAGEVRFAGQDLTSLSDTRMQRIRGPGIAMVFQEPMTSLNPVFTIGEQVMETIRAHERLSQRAIYARALEMLEKVGIPSAARRMGDYPHQLSGGQRQRVMLAIALACRPRLLIADEPTTALDVTIQAQILDLMLDLRDEFGMAIIIITHNMGVVAETADRVLVMYAGRIVEEAPVARLFDHPLHPYTRGLLECVPSLEQDHDAAGGDPRARCRTRRAAPPAAAFTPRCRYAVPGLRRRASRRSSRSTPATPPPASASAELALMAGSPLVEAAGLTKHFPVRVGGLLHRHSIPLRAVDDVALRIVPGETLGLVGESGCGKSTLGRLLIRLIPATAGNIIFDGADITRLDPAELREKRRAMQIIFQDPYGALNPRMSVEDIVMEPLLIHGARRNAETRAPGRRHAGAGRPAGARARPLPARVLRRPAPAHRHRPRAGAAAEVRGVRRTGLRAGCLGAGTDREPAAGPAGRTWA